MIKQRPLQELLEQCDQLATEQIDELSTAQANAIQIMIRERINNPASELIIYLYDLDMKGIHMTRFLNVIPGLRIKFCFITNVNAEIDYRSKLDVIEGRIETGNPSMFIAGKPRNKLMSLLLKPRLRLRLNLHAAEYDSAGTVFMQNGYVIGILVNPANTAAVFSA